MIFSSHWAKPCRIINLLNIYFRSTNKKTSNFPFLGPINPPFKIINLKILLNL